MIISEKEVMAALSQVEDPDLKKDLVSLGMIQNLTISGLRVSFDVELTTPACPMKDMIRNACINAVKHLVHKEALVEANMTARVTSGKTATQALPGIKNMVAVASGKGGVGKSTVAANLALGLARSGAKVGLLDADIYGPSVPTMFGLLDDTPEMQVSDGKELMVPIEKYGIKLMSIGFLIQPGQAVVWRGPMISAALRQLLNDVIWGDLDYLVIDMPPGTGDIHLTLATNFPLTGALLVTTPQQVALDDAQKGAAMFRLPAINIPLLGVVENMSWFTPKELPNNKYYIFGSGGGRKLAEMFNIELLASIPLSLNVSEGGDKGTPALISEDGDIAEAFDSMAQEVARKLAVMSFHQK
jgi:ATP-binding protein involved in chromosome partitioning